MENTVKLAERMMRQAPMQKNTRTFFLIFQCTAILGNYQVHRNNQDLKRIYFVYIGLRNTAKNGVLYNNIQYLRKKYAKKEEEKNAEAAGL